MLLTTERLIAATNVNRFGGWLRRPYSILEHSVIGALVMRELEWSPRAMKAFLLHDMHETEIMGDIKTPDKRRYVNARYVADVAEFDRKIYEEANLSSVYAECAEVTEMDAIMLACESQLLYTGEWQCYHSNNAATDVANRLIRGKSCSGLAAVDAFLDLFNDRV